MSDKFDHDQFVEELILIGNNMSKDKPPKPNSLAELMAKKSKAIKQEARIE